MSGLPTLKLLEELKRNRERLVSLEASMLNPPLDRQYNTGKMSEGIKAVDEILDHLEHHIMDGGGAGKRRNQAVAVMNLSLEYWVAATRTSKIELAERSGIWNVYIGKDGWARTQTLDRYLKLDSLPAKPGWKKVVDTANFVLTACGLASPLRGQLETALAELKAAL